VRSVLLAALVAALVGLGVRLAVLARGTDLPPDGVFDLEIARDLQHGEWRGAVLRRFHPLEGTLAAGVATLLGREADEACGLVVSVLAGTLAVFLVALAAGTVHPVAGGTVHPERDRGPEERGTPVESKGGLATRSSVFAALSAGLLAAAHPGLVQSSITVWSYPLSHAALAAALLAAAHAVTHRSVRSWALAGAAAGVGFLARPDGLVVGAGLLGASLVLALFPDPPRWPFDSKGAPRSSGPLSRSGRSGAMLLGFVLLASPYLLALRAATGEWRVTLKKDERHLVGMRDLQAPPPPPRPKGDLGAILDAAENLHEPEEIGTAASALYVLRRSATAIHPLLLALGALGLLWVGRPAIPGALVLGALLSAHTLLKVNEHDFTGHHAFLEAVVFAPWAGVALARLSPRRLLRTIALGGAFVILVAKAHDPHAALKGNLARAVAARLRARAVPGRELAICGRDARAVAFLAGARLVDFPRGDAATVTSAARAAGADWLAVYVRTPKGDEPRAVERALAATGLTPLEPPLTARRDAPEGGSILYTWLLYDLSQEKR
jgi:hypothetical protein